MSARDENKPHPPPLRGPMPSLTFTSRSRPHVITWSVSLVPASTLTALACPCDARMREPTSDMVSYALTGAAPGGGAQTVYPGSFCVCVSSTALDTTGIFAQQHGRPLWLASTRLPSNIRSRSLGNTILERVGNPWPRPCPLVHPAEASTACLATTLTPHTSNSRWSDMD
jgi:hypothetical protein